jgi:beta-galactosidase
VKLARISWILSFLFIVSIPLHSPARVTEDFDANWLFSKGDFQSAMMPEFIDASWRTVNVPHDWSIEGPFSPDYGSGNGFVPGGIGWYRKHFRLDPADKDKLVAIEFDGVYDDSRSGSTASLWVAARMDSRLFNST